VQVDQPHAGVIVGDAARFAPPVVPVDFGLGDADDFIHGGVPGQQRGEAETGDDREACVTRLVPPGKDARDEGDVAKGAGAKYRPSVRKIPDHRRNSKKK